MNRNHFLVYQLIFDKTIKRHIDLLIILKNNIRMSLIDLASSLNVNERTILRDANKLNSMLITKHQLFIKRGFAVLEGMNTQEMYYNAFQLIQESLSYKILNYAYDKPIVRLEDLAQIVHACPTALKSKIRLINGIISKRFHCRLSSYSSEIKGNEADIRYFYYTYFNELQLYFNVTRHTPEATEKVYAIYRDHLVKSMVQGIDCSMLHVEQLLVITIDRIYAKQYIQDSDSLAKHLKKNKNFSYFKALYSNFIREQFHITEINHGELYWAFISWLDTIVYSKHSENAITSYRSWTEKDLNVEYFVEEAFAQLSIDLEEHDKFVKLHYSFITNQILLSKMSISFQMLSREVKHLVKNNLSDAYRFWYEMLDKNRSIHIFQLQDDVACRLAMISSQFSGNGNTARKRVLFSLMGESGVITYLETIIRKIFSGYIDTIFVFNQPIDAQLLCNKRPDVVVCNHKALIGPFNNQFIRVSYLPTESEWVSVISQILV